jgi:hypothetical protein
MTRCTTVRFSSRYLLCGAACKSTDKQALYRQQYSKFSFSLFQVSRRVDIQTAGFVSTKQGVFSF